MDAVEIFLPVGTDLQSFGFKIPMYRWDGVDYPQGPPECDFGKNFKLKMADKMETGDFTKARIKRLPEKYQRTEWQLIDILGEGVDIYRNSLFGLQEEENGYGMKDLINALLQDKPHWVFGCEPQFDEPLKIYHGELKDIMITLELVLKNPENGFLIYH